MALKWLLCYEGADVAIIVQYGCHERIDGTGSNFEAFPGKFIERGDLVVATVAQI
jgi:hypothetical protein